MRSHLLAAALVLAACDDPPAETNDGGGTGVADAGSSADAGSTDAGSTSDAGQPDAGPVALPVVEFTGQYLAESWGGCNKPLGFVGFEPTAPGKYPLFVYVVGTLDNYGHSTGFVYTADKPNQVVLGILKEAAAKGAIAVSAEYDNFFLGSCDGARTKSRCIYDPTDANSVVTKLCARPNVDCSLGIVTAGHSQGSQIAVYAKNWNSRIRAVWGLGATSDYVGSFGSGAQPGLANPIGTADDRCLRDDHTALPTDRFRVVNGLDEMCYPGSHGFDAGMCGPAASQPEVERMTGAVCAPNAMSCLAPNGSGWVVIPNEAVEGGRAHHTWFGPEADAGVSRLEVHFAAPATEPWSLRTNLDWLFGFLGPARDVPIRINAGAMVAVDGAFSKDDFFRGTTVGASGTPVDVSASNAGPSSLYQSYRFEWPGGTLRCDVPGLTPNATYTVRLHFAETFFGAAGARQFHVELQGVRKETNLDVFAEAGGIHRALVKSYAVTADPTGKISLALPSGAANGPMIAGLEIL